MYAKYFQTTPLELNVDVDIVVRCSVLLAVFVQALECLLSCLRMKSLGVIKPLLLTYSTKLPEMLAEHYVCARNYVSYADSL